MYFDSMRRREGRFLRKSTRYAKDCALGLVIWMQELPPAVIISVSFNAERATSISLILSVRFTCPYGRKKLAAKSPPYWSSLTSGHFSSKEPKAVELIRLYARLSQGSRGWMYRS